MIPVHTSSLTVSTASRDAGVIAAILVAFWFLASQWELSEMLGQWLRRYESLQADEFSLTLFVLTLGLLWFAMRRLAETRLALAQQRDVQDRIADLLERNRHLTQRVIRTQEDERSILARELHDEVGQNCTALRIEAAWISHAKPQDWPGVVTAAQRIGETAQRMHSMARDMLRRLRPPSLDALGLSGALQELCNQWEIQCATPCTLQTSALPPLDEASSVNLYRVVQESLSNIAQHARATRVEVTLAMLAGQIQLVVEDNGIGLPDAPHRGLGMLGMQERVDSLRGQIAWTSAQPGTRVGVMLPFPEAP